MEKGLFSHEIYLTDGKPQKAVEDGLNYKLENDQC